MKHNFFPTMPDHINPLTAGRRTGLPYILLKDLKNDPSAQLSHNERRDVDADIADLEQQRRK